MIVFGIETSCDETACAVVRNGHEILANTVASQVSLHQPFGGVVPELACRRHVDLMLPMIKQTLDQARITPEEISLIAATNTPGLVGALLVGVNAAKAMALALNKPFIGINHIEAHLYAALMSDNISPKFPLLGAVFSGGHTSLILIKGFGDFQLVSNTIDDAVGEAFDKVAKMMGLPYPGGPIIEKLAKEGDPTAYALKPGLVKGRPLHFSFSGLKTAALYALKGQNGLKSTEMTLTAQEKANMAAAFQQAAFKDLVSKTLKAAKTHSCRDILFGGGVANSQTLRGLFEKAGGDNFNLYWPAEGLSLDNAAMVAGLAFHQIPLRGADTLKLEVQPRSCY